MRSASGQVTSGFLQVDKITYEPASVQYCIAIFFTKLSAKKIQVEIQGPIAPNNFSEPPTQICTLPIVKS